MTNPEYIQPRGVDAPPGPYSHLSRTGGFAFVAGQVGRKADGTLAGPDLESQARQTFANIETILGTQGADMRDVLKFTTYLVNESLIEPFNVVRRELFPRLYPDGQYPPNTMLIVSGLVRPELLIEIEAIAHIEDAA